MTQKLLEELLPRVTTLTDLALLYAVEDPDGVPSDAPIAWGDLKSLVATDLSAVVLLAGRPGGQTIDGDTTFTEPVTGETPTLDAHLTTKDYVDSDISDLSDSIADLAAIGSWGDVGATFGDGSAVVVAEVSPMRPVTTDGTIEGWYVSADQSGSVTIDVIKNGSSITGTGTKPNLSSQQNNSGSDFTNWGSTSLSAGDRLQLEITGTPSSVEEVTVVLKIERS